MANVKISSLPAASAITGPELVPVVQGGVTKQATVAQVTATANANAAVAATAAASASVLAATKVSSVTASSPLSSTGGTAPNISLSGVVPVANGGTGITSLGAGVATWLGTPSSANLASAVTDETGSGSLVFNAAPTISSPTISSGDITFSGLAQRIAGDFSNTTVANRLMVQTTTTNGNTLVGVMPNGTGNVSHISFYSSTDTVNGSFTRMGATSATSESYIQAGRSGTGTYYTLTFYAGGSRRVDIDTSGNLDIKAGNLSFSGTAQRITGDFSNATVANRLAFQSSTTNGITVPSLIPNGTAVISGVNLFNASDVTNASQGQVLINSTELRFYADKTGTGTQLPMTFYTSGSERMRIDSSGNVVQNTAAVATNATAGFLWITSCAGAPTGAPTAPYTNAAALVCDTTNNRLYVRVGSTWRYATLT